VEELLSELEAEQAELVRLEQERKTQADLRFVLDELGGYKKLEDLVHRRLAFTENIDMLDLMS